MSFDVKVCVVCAEHKGSAAVRDQVVLVVLIDHRTKENDATSEFATLSRGIDRGAGSGGFYVMKSEVKGRDGGWFGEYAEHGQSAGCIDQGGENSAVYGTAIRQTNMTVVGINYDHAEATFQALQTDIQGASVGRGLFELAADDVEVEHG